MICGCLTAMHYVSKVFKANSCIDCPCVGPALRAVPRRRAPDGYAAGPRTRPAAPRSSARPRVSAQAPAERRRVGVRRRPPLRGRPSTPACVRLCCADMPHWHSASVSDSRHAATFAPDVSCLRFHCLLSLVLCIRYPTLYHTYHIASVMLRSYT